jgi:broad specificity phosphatase PhoE
VEQWRADYDAAGLGADSRPPAALLEEAQRADLLITSDMLRARHSAERLADGRLVTETPLLRETALPIPRWPTRLPLSAWGALIYLRWKTGAPLDASEHARVSDAARYLVDVISPGTTALAVTHGVFRALLGEELTRAGWRQRERRGGYGHWSTWVFERPVPR